ncbi:G2-specific protein kinase nim-1 [Hypsizygus marmoreus]|uniref:non-specific serine/threonine protein kinase n=1 Tax=Hypsizygus marmoreus TaxID=39966 RepID=A0A369JN57_HYPMA|nr:G2-specific protein kinase nim-1 [Hypsizygus marmoreus]
MSSFLDQYDSLDVIGNGSFGIIRKVRRRADGMIFARKELNFERMSERDRKQIVAEVNILKDLHHDHIVRYHDRYVDREAGILYILMEYCGGGDLSTVIKQALKHNRPIPEETIWNYFMQILLALQRCHHPNGHARGPSGSAANGGTFEVDGGERRAQILHRDLKPDNVFLDEANTVKLGDFGLSKALPQASFASTYVGTPYYMSPELMQEKAYDSKSDIWSLGCLIYELCALKPPFHEAKTHSELSICIRNGRIPPLPRGYSPTLSTTIKSMLNLNPAMRPSAAQLLQHERLELCFKVAETEKMLTTVKAHKATIAAREREVQARESALLERENQLMSVLTQKDTEIASLQHMVTRLQEQQHHQQYSQQQVEQAIKEAVARREEELRVLVMKREKEVAEAMARREEEIMEAVRRREAEVFEAWGVREAEIQKEVEQKVQEVEERVEWVQAKEEELTAEDARLETARAELEENVAKWEENALKGRKEKTPLEEVKNLLAPLARIADDTPAQRRKLDNPTPRPLSHIFPSLNTPMTRLARTDFMPSAMKGVVLTATGETLATPTPAELANLFSKSPKVGLNFTKIFDFGDGDDDDNEQARGVPAKIEVNEEHSPPPSPSSRKEREKSKTRSRDRDRDPSSSDTGSSTSSSTAGMTSTTATATAPPTRLRRPSIRTSLQRPPLQKTLSLPASTSDPTGMSTLLNHGCSSTSQIQPKPLPHPHLNHTQASAIRSVTLPIPLSTPPPEYDLADEENLPSPFLKRTVSVGAAGRAAATALRAITKKRPSGGNTLRAVAAANAAGRRNAAAMASSENVTQDAPSPSVGTRPALASARKASEEARKALSRS